MTLVAGIDRTHDPALPCWVPGAMGHQDFPVQNLPMCTFVVAGRSRPGVLIGDHVLDLEPLAMSLDDSDGDLRAVVTAENLDLFCALPSLRRSRMRAIISEMPYRKRRTDHSKWPVSFRGG